MFLLRGMRHILGYVGSKIKTFFDDLTDDYSVGTFFYNSFGAFLALFRFFWAINSLTI